MASAVTYAEPTQQHKGISSSDRSGEPSPYNSTAD
jgi:hypothetical protein